MVSRFSGDDTAGVGALGGAVKVAIWLVAMGNGPCVSCIRILRWISAELTHGAQVSVVKRSTVVWNSRKPGSRNGGLSTFSDGVTVAPTEA